MGAPARDVTDVTENIFISRQRDRRVDGLRHLVGPEPPSVRLDHRVTTDHRQAVDSRHREMTCFTLRIAEHTHDPPLLYIHLYSPNNGREEK